MLNCIENELNREAHGQGSQLVAVEFVQKSKDESLSQGRDDRYVEQRL